MSNSSHKSIWPWIIVAVLAALAGMYFNSQRLSLQPQENAAQTKVVERLLNTNFPTSDGKTIQLRNYAPKTLLVNFWAPWCPPCVEEMPALSQLQTEFASKNVQFVGIGVDSADNIIKFTQKIKVNYPLFVAPALGLQFVQELGNSQGGLPYTVLISPNGVVLEQKLGKIQADELRQWLIKHNTSAN